MRIACFIFGSPGSGKTHITKYISKMLGLGDIETFNMSIDDRILNLENEYQTKFINKIKSSYLHKIINNDVIYKEKNINKLADLSSAAYYKIRRLNQDKILKKQIDDLQLFIQKTNCLVTIEATLIKSTDIYQCELKGGYLDLLKDAGFKVVFLYLYNNLQTIKHRIYKRNYNIINNIRKCLKGDMEQNIRMVPFDDILKSRDLVLDTVKHLLCKKKDNDIIILYNNKLVFYYNSQKNRYQTNKIKSTNDKKLINDKDKSTNDKDKSTNDKKLINDKDTLINDKDTNTFIENINILKYIIDSYDKQIV